MAQLAALRSSVRIVGICFKIRHWKPEEGREMHFVTVKTLGATFDLTVSDEQLPRITEGHMVQAECDLREITIQSSGSGGRSRTVEAYKLDVIDIARIEEPLN